MKKAMAILASAALFASGLAVGALGVHLFYSQRIVARADPPKPVGPMLEHWLVRNLDLSREQRAEVREILERSRAEAEALRREVGPRLEAMNRRTADQIAEVLTPEQRDRMERFMERYGRRGRFRDHPPRDHRFQGRP